jgi:hypothetical protein
MTGWRYGYHPQDMNYISAKAKAIRDTAATLGVPPLSVAGGIAREMTLERYEYPYYPARRAAQPLKELLTSSEPDWETGSRRITYGYDFPWKPITHDTIANYIDQSNMLPREHLKDLSYLDRFDNPAFFDGGPGNIKIRTAIGVLQNYNQMYPDSDPLELKRYNQRYNLLVRDLKDPDSDTTVKIAGVVAREGQNVFANAPAYSGGATEGPPSGDTSFQTDTPTGAYAPPSARGTAGLTDNASDDATDLATDLATG